VTFIEAVIPGMSMGITWPSMQSFMPYGVPVMPIVDVAVVVVSIVVVVKLVVVVGI
jgi:hypothetical protein